MTLILATPGAENRTDDILTQVREYTQTKFDRFCLPQLLAIQGRATKLSLDAMTAVSGVDHATLKGLTTAYRKRAFFIDPLTVEDPSGIAVPQGASLFAMDVRVPYMDRQLERPAELNVSAVSTVASPDGRFYYRFSLLEQDVAHAADPDPARRTVQPTQTIPADRFDPALDTYDVRHPVMFMSPSLISFLADPSYGTEQDPQLQRYFYKRFERLTGLLNQDLFRFTHDHFHGTVGRLWWDTDAHPASLDRFYHLMEDAEPMFVSPNGPLPNEEMLALKHYYRASEWLDARAPGIAHVRQDNRREVLQIYASIERDARRYGVPERDIEGVMNLMASLLLTRVASISDVCGPKIQALAEHGNEVGCPRFCELWQQGLENGRFRMHRMLAEDDRITVPGGQTASTAEIIAEFNVGMRAAAAEAPHVDHNMVSRYETAFGRMTAGMSLTGR